MIIEGDYALVSMLKNAVWQGKKLILFLSWVIVWVIIIECR